MSERKWIQLEPISIHEQKRTLFERLLNRNKSYVLVLRQENNSNQELLMGIGKFEAEQLAIAIEKMVPEMPLPIHLLRDTIETLEYQVEKITIDKLENKIFHASIHLTNKSGKDKLITARTTEAIGLAILTSKPILINEDVIAQNILTTTI